MMRRSKPNKPENGAKEGQQMIRVSSDILRFCSEYTLQVLFGGIQANKSRENGDNNSRNSQATSPKSVVSRSRKRKHDQSDNDDGDVTSDSGNGQWNDGLEGSDAESFLNMLIPETTLKEQDSSENLASEIVEELEPINLSDLPPPPASPTNFTNEQEAGGGDEEEDSDPIILPPPPQFGNDESNGGRDSPQMPKLEVAGSDTSQNSNSSNLSKNPPDLEVGNNNILDVWKTHWFQQYFQFECKQCDKSYDAQWKLNRHMKQQHDKPMKKPYVCCACGNTYVKLYSVKRHIRKSHKGKATFTFNENDKEEIEDMDPPELESGQEEESMVPAQKETEETEGNNFKDMVVAYEVLDYLMECVELLELYGGGGIADENLGESKRMEDDGKNNGDGAGAAVAVTTQSKSADLENEATKNSEELLESVEKDKLDSRSSEESEIDTVQNSRCSPLPSVENGESLAIVIPTEGVNIVNNSEDNNNAQVISAEVSSVEGDETASLKQLSRNKRGVEECDNDNIEEGLKRLKRELTDPGEEMDMILSDECDTILGQETNGTSSIDKDIMKLLEISDEVEDEVLETVENMQNESNEGRNGVITTEHITTLVDDTVIGGSLDDSDKPVTDKGQSTTVAEASISESPGSEVKERPCEEGLVKEGEESMPDVIVKREIEDIIIDEVGENDTDTNGFRIDMLPPVNYNLDDEERAPPTTALIDCNDTDTGNVESELRIGENTSNLDIILPPSDFSNDKEKVTNGDNAELSNNGASIKPKCRFLFVKPQTQLTKTSTPTT